MIDEKTATAIMESVDQGFDEQIAFTAELVKMPSVRGQEAAAQDFMARAMAGRGLKVDRWKINVEDIEHLRGFSPVSISYDQAFNVVGAHRADHPRGRSLILNGHIDVVPAGPLDGWTHPPFEPWIQDGLMYGRGSGDMKSGLVSGLFALEALKRLGLVPGADVYVQSVIEEECTGNGALACLQRGYRADLALIPEPSDGHLMRAEMGIMWFQVRIKGHPRHAATGEGANAIEKAYYLIQALKELEKSWNEPQNKHELYNIYEHPAIFNLGKIQGGDWASSVPAWCRFDMRIGFYPGWTLDRVRAMIEECLFQASEKDPFLKENQPQIIYHGFQAEGYVLEGADEAEAMLGGHHQRVFGQALVDGPATGATDGRFFGLYADTPALVYGPKCISSHGFDEAVDIESIRKTTQTIALFIADWCGLQSI